jgi:hypothetical protein
MKRSESGVGSDGLLVDNEQDIGKGQPAIIQDYFTEQPQKSHFYHKSQSEQLHIDKEQLEL